MLHGWNLAGGDPSDKDRIIEAFPHIRKRMLDVTVENQERWFHDNPWNKHALRPRMWRLGQSGRWRARDGTAASVASASVASGSVSLGAASM